MTEPNSKITDSEICTMRIMFPVTSDEQAIEYKKKINALLSEIPDASLQFSLMPVPIRPPKI